MAHERNLISEGVETYFSGQYLYFISCLDIFESTHPPNRLSLLVQKHSNELPFSVGNAVAEQVTF